MKCCGTCEFWAGDENDVEMGCPAKCKYELPWFVAASEYDYVIRPTSGKTCKPYKEKP